MIIRIMGEGQYEVPSDEYNNLQLIDEKLEQAVTAGDASATTDALRELRAKVLADGAIVPDDFLGSSDVVIPFQEATPAEVRELLSDDGLIPGTSAQPAS